MMGAKLGILGLKDGIYLTGLNIFHEEFGTFLNSKMFIKFCETVCVCLDSLCLAFKME